MPTYEYACTSCGERLEAVQSFSDDPLTTCPECGGELRKVFGAVGIVLKGSGFYKTDSRSSSKSARAASPSSGGDAATGGDGKAAGSADGSSGSGDKGTAASNGKKHDASPSKAASPS